MGDTPLVTVRVSSGWEITQVNCVPELNRTWETLPSSTSLDRESCFRWVLSERATDQSAPFKRCGVSDTWGVRKSPLCVFALLETDILEKLCGCMDLIVVHSFRFIHPAKGETISEFAHIVFLYFFKHKPPFIGRESTYDLPGHHTASRCYAMLKSSFSK